MQKSDVDWKELVPEPKPKCPCPFCEMGLPVVQKALVKSEDGHLVWVNVKHLKE